MATPYRLKRSAISGKRPQLSDLQLGELALNFNDGYLFAERDTGGVGIPLAERIIAAVGTKWAGHQINRVDFIRPNRSMSQIGG